ncbi:receptor-like protein 35 [Pistacia vera]|uniref:receptor-like protein 35 n=1 Tax=Pistacia vera TaxID=55513 RepID=UPI00126359A9|nr:receptor-like protein 35 [Pistacia vera]
MVTGHSTFVTAKEYLCLSCFIILAIKKIIITSQSRVANESLGVIPKEIGNLTQLKWMYLDSNKLQGAIPKEIGNLTQLKWMFLSAINSKDFSNNSLSGSLPENMCQHLPNLEMLCMSHNQLTGPIPQRPFQRNWKLDQLKEIYLGYNNLQGEIPYEIGNLRKLEILNLDSNNLVGPVPAAIFNISTITSLSLMSNKLSGILHHPQSSKS